MSQSLEVAVGGLVRGTDQADLDAEFEALLVDSGVLAFRVAHGVLRRREDAEDVAQEALARAYQSFGRLRDRARFRSWLVRISWRLALDHQRAATRRMRREQEALISADPADVESVASANEFRGRLWQAIGDRPALVSLDDRALRGDECGLEETPSFDRMIEKAGRET
jgi:DNA-directed RNA polymerase specialized sigma24 family protein